jgi:predicted dehydrogenase
MQPRITRRRLLHTILATGVAPLIVPRRLIAGSGETPPSEKLATAHIGVGGQGGGDLAGISSIKEVQVVALCDVDSNNLANASKLHPAAKTHRDWRKMLDEQKDMDAVVIAIPDHQHVPAALKAMLLGKHAYVEKPLAHTIQEARLMKETAARMKVVTQMGNGGHGGEGLRLWKEWYDGGVIGTIKEVHVWSDRPGNWWKTQGKPRPADTPPVPPNLDWDLWIGPAPMRPYNPCYHPMAWRGFWDFGCGALGDMDVHNADPAYYTLDLGAPEWVEAETSGRNNDTYPAWSIVTWHHPAKGNRPALDVKWYDGGKVPKNIPGLDASRNIGDNGLIFVGDKAGMLGGSHAGNPSIFPLEMHAKTKYPPKTIPRSPGHQLEWVRACKAGKPEDSKSGFWYSAPFTESLLVGMLAVRFPQRIEWDAEAMKAKNCPEADPIIRKAYRDGWKLPV